MLFPIRIAMLLMAQLVLALTIHAQGVDFLTVDTLAVHIAAAQRSGKLIFVDMYTDWCGPCRRMDSEVFSDPMIAEQLHAAFIPVKINAEKANGPAIAKKYQVVSYPTYLVLDEKGNMVHRILGYRDRHKFAQEIDSFLGEYGHSMSIVQYDSLYAGGQRDEHFLYKYLIKRTGLGLNNAVLLDSYCAMLSADELSSERTLQLIADNARRLQIGLALSTLLQNEDKWATVENINDRDTYIDFAQGNTFKQALATQSDSLFNLVLKLNATRNVAAHDMDCNAVLKMRYLHRGKRWAECLRHTTHYVESELMPIGDDELRRADRAFYDEMFSERRAQQPDETDAQIDSALQAYQRIETLNYLRTLLVVGEVFSSSQASAEDNALAARWLARGFALLEESPRSFKYLYPDFLKRYATCLYRGGDVAAAIGMQSKALEAVRAPGIAQDQAEIEAFALLLADMKAQR